MNCWDLCMVMLLGGKLHWDSECITDKGSHLYAVGVCLLPLFWVDPKVRGLNFLGIALLFSPKSAKPSCSGSRYIFSCSCCAWFWLCEEGVWMVTLVLPTDCWFITARGLFGLTLSVPLSSTMSVLLQVNMGRLVSVTIYLALKIMLSE